MIDETGYVHLRYKVTNRLGDCIHRTTLLSPEKAEETEAHLKERHGDGLIWCKREPKQVIQEKADLQVVSEITPE